MLKITFKAFTSGHAFIRTLYCCAKIIIIYLILRLALAFSNPNPKLTKSVGTKKIKV